MVQLNHEPKNGSSTTRRRLTWRLIEAYPSGTAAQDAAQTQKGDNRLVFEIDPGGSYL